MREEELKDFGLVMEGKRLPLINASTTSSRRNWCWKLKSRYSQTFVTSVSAILCLVWLGIMESSVVLLIRSRIFQYSYKFNLILSVLNFVYPVCGYLGERWTRYYVIMTGTFIASGGCIMLQIVLLLDNILVIHNEDLVFALAITGTVAFSCGLGLFSANIIQFSAAQLPDASSQQLASFARWWVFALSVARSIGLSLGACMSLLQKSNLVVYLIVGIIFLLSIAGIMIGICFRRKFTIESPRSIDPVKLIHQVIKYAWKHKYPERPSSFTYTDDNAPSRLDFGKERYGGPFTTDQVESVKSFGRILAVLLSSILFCRNFLISDDSIKENLSVFSNDTLSDSLLNYIDTKNVLVVMIPVLQLMIMPCFPWLVSSTLKRMWFGLFLNVLCFVVATILKLVNIADFKYFIIDFSIIHSIGSALIVFSSLEFIFAQASCDMQGLLIGIWFIQFGEQTIILYLFKNASVFYCVTTGLLIVSLVAYSVAVYYYKYRVRNELSDINVQARIEEVYERDFRKEDQETDNDKSFFLSSSVQTLHTCN